MGNTRLTRDEIIAQAYERARASGANPKTRGIFKEKCFQLTAKASAQDKMDCEKLGAYLGTKAESDTIRHAIQILLSYNIHKMPDAMKSQENIMDVYIENVTNLRMEIAKASTEIIKCKTEKSRKARMDKLKSLRYTLNTISDLRKEDYFINNILGIKDEYEIKFKQENLDLATEKMAHDHKMEILDRMNN